MEMRNGFLVGMGRMRQDVMRRGGEYVARRFGRPRKPPIVREAAIAAGCAAAGGAIVWFLDPDRGRRRRALAADQVRHARRKIADTAGITARDAQNRMHGLAAAARRDHRPVEDAVLVERVRAELGRLVRYPRSVDVTAEDGAVTLSGEVLSDELGRLVSKACRIGGVREVRNHLGVRAVAGLQEVPARPEPRFELLQTHWAPAPRALVSATAAGMVGLGLKRHDPAGLAAAAAGALLLGRAVFNRPLPSRIDASIRQRTYAEAWTP